MLKPQDLLVLLKLAAQRGQPWTYPSLAASVGVSVSETHASVKRAAAAGLFSNATGQPANRRLLEFVVHGVPYVYHVDRGIPTTRGILTGFASPPLDGPAEYAYEALYVWPHPEGVHAGWSVSPLYRSAPVAALRDPALYALLALVDELRLGRARERNRAADLLASRLA